MPQDSERETFVRQQLQGHFDFEAFYEVASQDFWHTWSDEQKKNFASRFETLFLKSLAGKFQKAFSPSISLGPRPAEISGQRARQTFKVTKGDQSVSFTVHLIRRESGWKIYDVEFEEILVSRNYRAQFNRILRNEGYPGLIARFDAKLSELGGTQ